MANDPYDPMRKLAVNLDYKVRDFIGGDHTHPSAAALQHEARQLIEDLEVKKHPRTVENRIKTIQLQLKQAQNLSNSYMNYNEFDYLHDSYENMRRNLRDFNNY